MHMRISFITLCILLLPAAGCKTSKKAEATIPEVTDWLQSPSVKKLIKDKSLYEAITGTIPLDSAYVSADTLHLFTPKISGCSAEDFMLVWNGAMMKSLPPQVNLKLFHRVIPDCQQSHPFHLMYQLSPLKLKNDSLPSAVDSGADSLLRTVVIRMAGWKEPMRFRY